MRKLLTVALIGTMFLTGCSTAWLTTAESILAAAAPALINILEIAALAEGKPVNANLAAKVNGDAAALTTILKDYSAAAKSAQPQICPQLQAALTTYESDLPAVLSVAQVSNPNVASKIEIISSLVVGVFGSIEPLIPGCQAPTAPAVRAMTMKLQPAAVDVKTFIDAYNGALVSPTGNPSVDKATPKMKLYHHSKAVRVLTLGIAK
jgi:hypothetical protein